MNEYLKVSQKELGKRHTLFTNDKSDDVMSLGTLNFDLKSRHGTTLTHYITPIDFQNKQNKKPQDYIFVKDPKKVKKKKPSSPSFNTENDVIETSKSKNNFDEMHVIKESIGNILYEKWFLENFSKNTEFLDKLPKKDVNKGNFMINYVWCRCI